MGRRRNLTTEALAEVARRQGIRHEQERVREAWDRGLYAVRSAGSGSGTSAYPKPDLLIFNRDGAIDLVQSKTTRRYTTYFEPEAWGDELLAAERLKALGFRVRVWLDFTLYRLGRGNSINLWFRIDEHPEEKLTVKFLSKGEKAAWNWTRKHLNMQQVSRKISTH